MDRNGLFFGCDAAKSRVALRKESVDRNASSGVDFAEDWLVALRKESVDRNTSCTSMGRPKRLSLSARRAWIEISIRNTHNFDGTGRSPQGERG